VTSILLQGVPTTPGEFTSQYGEIIVSFGITVVSFIVAFLLLYAIGKPLLVRVTKRALNARDFSPSIVSLGSSIAGSIAVFGAMAVAATVAGFPAILSAFATIAGALALGFAFAASDIVQNFVAGVFIIKDEPFVIGDYIEWDGNDGIVREINLRVTKLDTFNNERLTVPNGDLANAVVKNPVANDTRRLQFDFGIEYEGSIRKARKIIIEEAEEIEGVLADPKPSAPVTGLADSAVILNGRIWINPKETSAGSVRNQWVEAVKRSFDAEGVGMPYPHTELTGGIEVNSPQMETEVADD